MECETCLRCGGEMYHVGQERLQRGKMGLLLGAWDNLLSGAMTVDVYCCRDCKKLEFYAVEEPTEAGSGIAQVPCPYCGLDHDMDDVWCPHCNKRLV